MCVHNTHLLQQVVTEGLLVGTVQLMTAALIPWLHQWFLLSHEIYQDSCFRANWQRNAFELLGVSLPNIRYSPILSMSQKVFARNDV
jgi:hypothetical protein